MNVGIGYKCPFGHFSAQIIIGDSKCPQCGAQLVSNADAPDIAMNRYCKVCDSNTGLNVIDDGKCRQCGTPY
jgi:hypothetical protein